MSYCGEIIASDSTRCTAILWEQHSIPTFGSIIIIETSEYLTFGVVSHIQTGSSDPHRQPFAYRMDEHTLAQQHPEISAFLQTTCQCIMLGFTKNSIAYYRIPPTPPRIHTFIRPASTRELQIFFSQPDYLYLLLPAAGITSIDEVLLALLSNGIHAKTLSENQLLATLTLYCQIIGNDYRRIRQLTQRLQHVIHPKSDSTQFAFEKIP